MKIATWCLALCAAIATGANAVEPAATPLPAGVVVRQSGLDLTMDDIDARIARVPAEHRAGFFNDPERIEQTLRTMLIGRILAQQATDLGLAADPLVQAEIEAARTEVLARHRLARFAKSLPEIDQSQLARENYLANPDKYSTPDQYDVRHLLIMFRNHGVDEAKRLAGELREQFIREGGEFEAFVRAHSEETTAKEDGGLLPNVKKGDTEIDFQDTFLALKPGEVSQPVKTKWGMHLIQLVAVHPGGRQPYEEVKATIESELAAELRKRQQGDFMARVRSGSLEANEELVASLRTRYLPEGEGQKALERVEQPKPGEYERYSVGTGTMDGKD
jgi:peptidyl-prolyl cis-trans isomerase C